MKSFAQLNSTPKLHRDNYFYTFEEWHSHIQNVMPSNLEDKSPNKRVLRISYLWLHSTVIIFVIVMLAGGLSDDCTRVRRQRLINIFQCYRPGDTVSHRWEHGERGAPCNAHYALGAFCVRLVGKSCVSTFTYALHDVPTRNGDCFRIHRLHRSACTSSRLVESRFPLHVHTH